MNSNLTGMVALVTSNSTGVVEGTARMLGREGATVVVQGCRRARIEEVAAGIWAKGGSAVDTEEGAGEVHRQVVGAAGPIDILVNAVGISHARDWMETTPAQWPASINADAVSAVRMARHRVPAMKKRGFGRIVQIASNAAHIVLPHLADYAASKAALISMTVSLAQSLAGTGIKANTVSPGPISTPTRDEWALEEGGKRGWGDDLKTVKRHLLEGFFATWSRRFGSAGETGAMVALISGPKIRYVNCSNLKVDGDLVPIVN